MAATDSALTRVSAVAHLRGEANFLEQAVFVDEISEASARELQQVGVSAWKVAMREVMGKAQERFDADQALAGGEHRQRGAVRPLLLQRSAGVKQHEA